MSQTETIAGCGQNRDRCAPSTHGETQKADLCTPIGSPVGAVQLHGLIYCIISKVIFKIVNLYTKCRLLCIEILFSGYLKIFFSNLKLFYFDV